MRVGNPFGQESNSTRSTNTLPTYIQRDIVKYIGRSSVQPIYRDIVKYIGRSSVQPIYIDIVKYIGRSSVQPIYRDILLNTLVDLVFNLYIER